MKETPPAAPHAPWRWLLLRDDFAYMVMFFGFIGVVALGMFVPRSPPSPEELLEVCVQACGVRDVQWLDLHAGKCMCAKAGADGGAP